MLATSYGYGGGYGVQGGVAGGLAEFLSLALIFASFLVAAYLAAKVKSRRSFQFEMFLFMVVLAVAEVPRTLYSLGVIDLAWLGSAGLVIHSVSMVVLSAFVAYRAYGFFRGEKGGK